LKHLVYSPESHCSFPHSCQQKTDWKTGIQALNWLDEKEWSIFLFLQIKNNENCSFVCLLGLREW
jgi:hypothetical protein